MDNPTKFFTLRYAVSHGALPAGMLGALADFGTPVGLYWFGWGLAVAYLLALGLFITRPGARQKAYDFMCAPDEARRQPFLVNPFAWALLVGAGISGLGGVLSYLSREDGGFFASNVEVVQQMQQANLLLARSIEVQERIAAGVGEVKRETSADPAKELANLGFDMSPQGIQSAINLSNVRAVHLFADAKSRISASSFGINHPIVREQLNPLWKVVQAGDEPMAEALARLGTANDAFLCFANPGYGRGAAAILSTTEQKNAFRTLCAGGTAELTLRAGWQQREQSQTDQAVRRASCEREASAILAGLDMAKRSTMHQVLSLGGNHSAKLAGGSIEPLKVEEATASIASQLGSEPRFNGADMELRFPQESIEQGAREACAQVLDPSHPLNQFATQDEDYRAMLAALDA